MVLSSASQLNSSDNGLSQPRRCQTALRSLTLVVEDVEEEASGVKIDVAVVCVGLVVGAHLVPPWRRAGLIPLRGCRSSVPRLKDPRRGRRKPRPQFTWRQ